MAARVLPLIACACLLTAGALAGEPPAFRAAPPKAALASPAPARRPDATRLLPVPDRPEAIERIVAVAAAAARRLQSELASTGEGLESELRRCHAEFLEYSRTPGGLADFRTRRDRIFASIRVLEEAERAEEQVLEQAARALGRVNGPEALRRLIDTTRRPAAPPLTLAFVRALGDVSDPSAAARLSELLDAGESEPAVRVAAAEALGRKPAGNVLPRLLAAYPRVPAPVQWAILRALDRLDDPGAIPPLMDALPSSAGRTRDAIEETLSRLCGRPPGGDAAAWADGWAAARDGFVAGRPDRGTRVLAAARRDTVPTFLGLPVTGRAVVFCVDLSTSMEEAVVGEGARRADVARQAIRQAIGALPRGARFNVILFAWHLRVLAPGRLLPANPEGAEAALALLRETGLRHGTSLGDALDRALNLGRGPGGTADPLHTPDTIYLLSDGDPTTGPRLSGRAIRRRVRDLNGSTRIALHVVAIAPEPRGEAFLKALAEENGGQYLARGRHVPRAQ